MRPPAIRRALPCLMTLACLSLGGCGVFHIFDPTLKQRGSLVEPDALNELIPGTSSRADAVALIGSPTARATFDDNTWIYISQVTSTRIGRTPGVNKQKVVVLTFDRSGTLRGIAQRTRADSKPITMAAGPRHRRAATRRSCSNCSATWANSRRPACRAAWAATGLPRGSRAIRATRCGKVGRARFLMRSGVASSRRYSARAMGRSGRGSSTQGLAPRTMRSVTSARAVPDACHVAAPFCQTK